MKSLDINWNNIDMLEEHHLTYLFYKEGRTIEQISKIRRMTKEEVERDIIKYKAEMRADLESEDLLIKIISMDKSKRIEYLSTLTREEKDILSEDITKRYPKFKNEEDRVIIIWLIGELKDERFLPYLRMELRSNRVNFRRLACSALGKINHSSAKDWLEKALGDTNPQVRQYAAKALTNIGDYRTAYILKKIVSDTGEKNYVKRAAKVAIEKIEKAY